MKKTGAVILAAGMSTRMHAFKPLLPYGESTIAGHMADMLIRLGADPVFFVTGFRAEELEKELAGRRVGFIRNEHYATTQMFDSVKIGLNEVQKYCERVMLMPVDIPAIMEDTVRNTMRIDAPLIRTVCRGKPGHPIIIEREIIPRICGYEGDRGLRGAMEESGVRLTEFEVDDEFIYRDADTADEYNELIIGSRKIKPAIKLRLDIEKPFFGPGSCELLELIEKKGSVRRACAEMELSYSKGMKIIKNAEKGLGFRVAERIAGGSGGGGSRLTDDGRKLVHAYRYTESRLGEAAALIFSECMKPWK